MELKDILSKCDHTLLAQTATWDEIKAICPSLQGYSVGEEYAGHSGRDARVVAHVRTSEALSAEDRTRVERLIRVHVPDLDHVEYATSG